MTLRFASARSAARSPIARALQRRRVAGADNDNCGNDDDRLLHAALRHFAAHGLHAAREARKQAEHAFFAGDREGYDWWLGVCRTLDRRLAAQVEQGMTGNSR
jgi:hypothetical protein